MNRLALAAAAADTVLAAVPKARRVRYATKPLIVPLLAAPLVQADSANRPLRKGFLAGLGFGWIGDIALLGTSEEAFLAGAGSFGVGHLAYVGSLARLRRRPFRPTAATVGAALTTAAIGPFVARAAGKDKPAMGLVVAGYAGLVASTLAAAGQLDPSLPAWVRRSAIAGGLLFLVSDGLIGVRMFLTEDGSPMLDSAVMATYSAAQALLVDAAMTRVG